jgi:hypothetical protein
LADFIDLSRRNLHYKEASEPGERFFCYPTTKTVTAMPHALSMPAPGFQAVILCGPGSSFPTFTSNPDENPKALIPIANRPMVWYPIDFCYRMGVTSE